MPLDTQTVAAYSPWSNAILAFQVPGTTLTINTDTGNYNYNEETVEYIAHLNIQPPNWKSSPGTDQTTYNVSGRLLSPSTLDPRIISGSQALATLNGIEGRFELVFDLSMHAASRPDLKQPISGIFRVTGGG